MSRPKPTTAKPLGFASSYDNEENVATIRMEWPKVPCEQWFLLQSDEHFDNEHCDRVLYKRHLDEALARNAGIIKFGDTFCVMQGPNDKRSSLSALRDAHKQSDYFNRVLEDAVEFHRPYARNMIGVGIGNHESSVTKKYGWDITALFVDRLRRECNSPVVRMGYSGWMRFMATANKNTRSSLRLWYTHGYGGGGPVTLDSIQSQRQMAFVHGADITVSGHTHDSWIIERVAIGLSDCGKQTKKTTVQVKLPTYKDEYGKGEGGWHIETGKPPKPLGAYWLRTFPVDGMMQFEVQRAR
jgi:predicted phosphodiesterase